MIVASEWYLEYADAKGKASVQYVEMDADQADQVEEKLYDSDSAIKCSYSSLATW